jgi:hypothetical protein
VAGVKQRDVIVMDDAEVDTFLTRQRSSDAMRNLRRDLGRTAASTQEM